VCVRRYEGAEERGLPPLTRSGCFGVRLGQVVRARKKCQRDRAEHQPEVAHRDVQPLALRDAPALGTSLSIPALLCRVRPRPTSWLDLCGQTSPRTGGRRKSVCYSCGCKLAFESHGDPRNIVEQMFIDAGKTKEIKNAGRAKAKENVLELIRIQQEAGELEEPRESYAEPDSKKG
jgi:hypothetical protein